MAQKYILLFSILTLVGSSAFAQGFYFGIKSNQFSTYTEDEVIDVDTLIARPSEEEINKRIDVDLIVRKQLSNDFWLDFRLGVIHSSRFHSLTKLFDNGANGYAIGTINSNNTGYRVTFGLQKSIVKKQQIRLSGGMALSYAHLPEFLQFDRRDFFDSDGDLSSVLEDNFRIPATGRLGVMANLNCYYWFFERVGIGFEIEPYLRYDWQEGDVFERPQRFDENGNLLSQIEITRERTSSSVLISNRISLGIQVSLYSNSN
ncbi:hypothetical protein [Phaeodactylibacter xiamenensis]|uniref:hypothetical protein n=1 Tax=Phaeodactylibacter xiamenensis TaxID=1524460 RepID=UPI0024A8363B|nr:hypothetical protein [Phaeodactylibacter xiamenensis]